MPAVDAPPTGVRVQFWGVRGSIPTPGPTTARYGGNTSCVTVEGPDGALYILDAGSGIRPLGLSLAATGRLPLTAHLLLTHTHWDHIQGLPFFIPAYIPGNRLHCYSSQGGTGSLEEVLAGQMSPKYFPISMDVLGADLTCTELAPGTHQLGPATVVTAPMQHPGHTLGYRLELAGRVIAAVWDEEPQGGPADLTPNPPALRLAQGADLLIHDAQYTDQEYADGKVGWGHSPLRYAVTLAVAARVPRLVLFHHDPIHTDSFLDQMVRDARARAAALDASELVITAAREGDRMELAPPPPATQGRPATERPAPPPAALLQQVPLFRALTRSQRAVVATQVDRQQFARGTIIFQQGDPGDTLYVIVAGQVKISRQSVEGDEAILALLDAGECFGELALFDGQPRSATVTATAATEVLRLARPAFQALLAAHRDLPLALLRILAQRLRATDVLVAETAFLGVRARLVKTLVRLANSQGRPTAEGVEIDIGLTQRELAAMVNAAPATVNRQLAALREEGLVTVGLRRLTIRDLAALREQSAAD